MRTLPMVNDLRSANWAALNPSQRLEALQRMENERRGQGRNACELATIDPEVLAKGNNGESLFGQHKPAGIGSDGKPTPEVIEINPALLADGKPPYAAVETYFHEARTRGRRMLSRIRSLPRVISNPGLLQGTEWRVPACTE